MKAWLLMILMIGCGVKYTETNESTDTGATEESTGEDVEQGEDTDSEDGTESGNGSDQTDTEDANSEEDTGSTNDTDDVTLYGCNVAELGICFEGFISDGWTETVARESCSEYSVTNDVATETLSSGCPMTPETVVGACILTNTFEDLVVTGWYYTSHWTEAAAQATCTEQEGLFVQ